MTGILKLIEENKTNHFKLLTIVGNNYSKIERLVDFLKNHNWVSHDVENVVFEIMEKIPEDKIRLRIGGELKRWIKSCDNKMILLNSNILYSNEMDKIGPFTAFKYHMRGVKEGILFLDARLRGNNAIYSTPERDDYSERELSDVLFVNLDDVEIGDGDQ